MVKKMKPLFVIGGGWNEAWLVTNKDFITNND